MLKYTLVGVFVALSLLAFKRSLDLAEKETIAIIKADTRTASIMDGKKRFWQRVALLLGFVSPLILLLWPVVVY